MAYSRIEVRPLTSALGAEIHGVDLAREADPAVYQEIRQALLDNLVIFFRDQDLTPAQHKAVAARFGEIEINPIYKSVDGHPEVMPVIKEKHDKKNIGDTWHTDMSYLERPPLGSILYAREVPPAGGDTMFANQYLAYETLSDALRAVLDPLQAVHSDFFVTGRIKERNKDRSTQLREDLPETAATHPVIRRHDETGRKALYVNFPLTRNFVGMTREESLPLLSYLYGHAVKPEFTCRFRWTKGAIAFWDNRCTQHYALDDYHGYRREMHRITIAGPRPQ
jgi:taurine dioxygenase